MVLPINSVARNRNSPMLFLVDMTFFSFDIRARAGPGFVKTTEQRLRPFCGRATARFSNQYLRSGGFCSEFLSIGEQYRGVPHLQARRPKYHRPCIDQSHRRKGKKELMWLACLRTGRQFSAVRENSRGWDCKQKIHVVPWRV
jgi:hypothetical protein